jgi:hypothetical protein
MVLFAHQSVTQWDPPPKVPVLAREIKRRKLICVNAESNERATAAGLPFAIDLAQHEPTDAGQN